MSRICLWTAMLLGLCPLRAALGGQSASIPRATPEQVRQTVDRAVGYLQIQSAIWLKTRHCAACHDVAMPLWAVGEAERQGYPINTAFLADTIESLLGSRDKLIASRIFPDSSGPVDPRPSARGLNMGLPFLAVAAQSSPSLNAGQRESLKRIDDEIVKKQQQDGSWEFFAGLRRPPINQSQFTDVAWIIMALQGQQGQDVPPAHREALAKATAWFDANRPAKDQQENALKVIVSLRSGKPRKIIQASIDQLLALQRDDGGWSQTVPEPRSDAFATGQTLYALSLAGMTAHQTQIRRAIDFLVATQKPDGSWPMTSRATPDGSPGSAKNLNPITCASSSWAVLGLARVSAGPMRSSQNDRE